MPQIHTRSSILVALVLLLPLAGCSQPKYQPSGDPILDLRNPDLTERKRLDAADIAWGEAEGGVRDLGESRQAFKDLAWSQSTPLPIRQRLVSLLMSDTSEAGAEDSRRLAALMLPRESERSIVAILASTAGTRGWTDLTPALVRSYARPVEDVDDSIRTERAALRDLHPGRSIEEVVFDVFIDPGEGPGREGFRWAERARADAWELLSRLDPEGAVRTTLLTTSLGTGGMNEDTSEMVADLRRCLHDMGAIPRTAMELEWMRSLLRATDAEQRDLNAAWWSQASGSVGSLVGERRNGLELRHLEPIRWAGEHRPAWLRASREELLGELDGRLLRRETHRRTKELGVSRGVGLYRYRDWRSSLDWADALTLLVIDEALQSTEVRARLFQYARADRDDRKTEYGGTLEARGVTSAGEDGFRLILFRPRASDRRDDNRFVASEDMLRYSDRALAHYHMHVQKARNGKYAGPSEEDLRYAKRSGRTCLVFTSLNADRMNVDVYAPDGTLIDLGEVSR
ncbi:MAG: hypothetical protein ACIARR_07945 [Phycisphaerales bacterium JB059]